MNTRDRLTQAATYAIRAKVWLDRDRLRHNAAQSVDQAVMLIGQAMDSLAIARSQLCTGPQLEQTLSELLQHEPP